MRVVKYRAGRNVEVSRIEELCQVSLRQVYRMSVLLDALYRFIESTA